MKKFLVRSLAVCLVALPALSVGCSSKTDDRQPRLAGPVDPRIKGPARAGFQPASQARATTLP